MSGTGTTLETPRLRLRPLELSDAPLLNAWENDPELLHFNDDESECREPESLEKTVRSFELDPASPADGTLLTLAICLKESGAMIGYESLFDIDPVNGRCKIGITIGDKRHWGGGLAREALGGLIDLAFGELELNRIMAEIYAFNTRSLALFEKLGFQREGLMRQSVRKPGGWADEYLYSLLKDEWNHRLHREPRLDNNVRPTSDRREPGQRSD